MWGVADERHCACVEVRQHTHGNATKSAECTKLRKYATEDVGIRKRTRSAVHSIDA